MSEITERTKAIIQQDRLDDIRSVADDENTFCFFASLYEIATLNKGTQAMPPRVEGVWAEHLKRFPDLGEGSVPVSQTLEVLFKFNSEFGLTVKQILVNPSFLKHISIPTEFQVKIRTATGSQDVPTPHLRCMAQQGEEKIWYTHAETDAGDAKSESRFELLKEKGWELTALVVEYENDSSPNKT